MDSLKRYVPILTERGERLLGSSLGRAVKRRMNAKQGFRPFRGALQTIQGYEVIRMIRKGKVRWLPKGDVAGQVLFIKQTLGGKAA